MLFKNNADFLEINIIKRSNPNANDYWDANWLDAEIKINVQGFTAHYQTNLRAEDFTTFYENMSTLQQGKANEIKFTTIEDGLYLNCKMKSTGTLVCSGIAKHENNNLNFNLTLNGALDEGLVQLQNILKSYPIIGSK
jgi:hypothetical protein